MGEIIMAYSGLTLHQAILLMAFIFAFLAFLGWFVSTYGIETKWFTVGGQKKQNNNIFSDNNIREELKRKIDEIDNDTINNLYDLARQVSRNFNNYLHNGHCYFTLYEISDVFKDALKARLRRNNLKNAFRKSNKTFLTEQLMSIVREEYNDVKMKASGASCKDMYPDFSEIENEVKKCLDYFFDKGNEVEIKCCKRKINVYEQYSPEFKIEKLKLKYCDEPLKKNREYLENLNC